MSKIKVSTLSGPQLDYWVAKAEKLEGIEIGRDGKFHGSVCQADEDGNDDWYIYSPSTDWSQGGPIIEQMKPDSFYYWKSPAEWICAWGNGPRWQSGKTALIAAMRCYVSSKFGEEVDE